MKKCNYCEKKLNKKNLEKHTRVCKIIYDENLFEIYSKFHELYNFTITWYDFLSGFNIGGSTFSKYRRYHKIPVNENFRNKPHTKETLEKMKLTNGVYRKGSGRGIKGWYKNYWCDSTYELCWLIYQLDMGNKPKRMDIYYEYCYGGKIRKYYPDFLLDDVIYEIKGYETEKDKYKYESVRDKELKVLMASDLKYIFEYVYNKYNTKNYYELYDIFDVESDNIRKKNKRNKQRNNCKCGKIKGKRAKSCRNCYNNIQRGVERPSHEQLVKEIEETNYCAVGRKYGVSDNAIRKWVKQYKKQIID